MLGIGLSLGSGGAISGGGQASTAVLTAGVGATGAGTSKSKFVDVATPFHQAIVDNNLGADCLARATTAGSSSKFHAEFTCDGLFTGGDFICGFDANVLDLNSAGTGTITATNRPGNSGGTAGITIISAAGYAAFDVYANGSFTSPALTDGAFAVGDACIVEVDPIAHTYAIYHWRPASSTATLIVTTTLTSQIPASNWAFCGGQRGTGIVSGSDTVTFLGGNSKMALSSGYGIYG